MTWANFNAGIAFRVNFIPVSNMAIRTPQLPQLNLARQTYERPFFVDMEAFFEFSFWMSEELLDLESRFADENRPKLQPVEN
jgi:hypothetical protein